MLGNPLRSRPVHFLLIILSIQIHSTLCVARSLPANILYPESFVCSVGISDYFAVFLWYAGGGAASREQVPWNEHCRWQ